MLYVVCTEIVNVRIRSVCSACVFCYWFYWVTCLIPYLSHLLFDVKCKCLQIWVCLIAICRSFVLLRGWVWSNVSLAFCGDERATEVKKYFFIEIDINNVWLCRLKINEGKESVNNIKSAYIVCTNQHSIWLCCYPQNDTRCHQKDLQNDEVCAHCH